MKREHSRREFLAGAIAVGAVGAAGLLETACDPIPRPERGIRRAPSELFSRQISGYTKFYGELTKDDILFVDDYGQPMEVVGLQRLGDYLPGKIDKDGFLYDGLVGAWLKRQRELICVGNTTSACDPENKKPRELNVIDELRNANEKLKGEKDFHPKTLFDIVLHYGRKKTHGDSLSRIDYVRAHALENTLFLDSLKDELKRRLPGLAAQESRFNNDLVSPKGALGIFQFRPITSHNLGYTKAEMLLLSKQVEAAGKYVVDTFGSLHANVQPELKHIQKTFFLDDAPAFEKHFIAPTILNVHNTGIPIMAEVLKWFAENFPSMKGLDDVIGAHPDGYGYDVFYAMAKRAGALETKDGPLANYKTEASEYIPRVYAWSDLIEREIA